MTPSPTVALCLSILALAVSAGCLMTRPRRRRPRRIREPFMEGVASMTADQERWQADVRHDGERLPPYRLFPKTGLRP